jgi:hypothetical protein
MVLVKIMYRARRRAARHDAARLTCCGLKAREGVSEVYGAQGR